ncbi:DoxX family protein [Lysinibacter sp. HNR]|uniref:DoxX family protein n=1 Tax=Lysinibacter sp. HNR TaxID=3031408 RepID=UPI002436085F|nr:DoxX family protein [Lysinibacter sp. HNR]WGD37442.1 DoxX family protein [Lysinibacter sp. HNR]
MTRTAQNLAVASTILRLTFGFIFFAHGWQKYFEFTIAGTQGSFTEMGIPAADIAAIAVATLELVGGAALILGVLTRLFALLLTLSMLGALFMVHAPSGIFVQDGGYEFVLTLAAGALAIALVGSGPLSIDRLLFGNHDNAVCRMMYTTTTA